MRGRLKNAGSGEGRINGLVVEITGRERREMLRIIERDRRISVGSFSHTTGDKESKSPAGTDGKSYGGIEP